MIPQPQSQTAAASAEQVRRAWQRRNDTDYLFNFWTQLGWTLLSCGVYGIYVFYQLMRRSRDHLLRRIELIDGATWVAWAKANDQGVAEELRPEFERLAGSMQTLRTQAGEFRDPAIWTLLSFVAGGIAHVIAYVLLDKDLTARAAAERDIEQSLTRIYGRLGAAVSQPVTHVVKGPHNYVGRIVATLASCGVYMLWWVYNLMEEGNEHFVADWAHEDSLAAAVHQLSA